MLITINNGTEGFDWNCKVCNKPVNKRRLPVLVNSYVRLLNDELWLKFCNRK